MFQRFFKSSIAQIRLVQQASLSLHVADIIEGQHYRNITGDLGCYGGLGVSIGGIGSEKVARDIGRCMVDNPKFTLFYLNPKVENAVYVGPIAQNEKQWLNQKLLSSDNGIHSQNHQALESYSFAPATEPSFTLKMRFDRLMNQLNLGNSVAFDVERDQKGLSALISGVPDRETAITLQQAIISDFWEFRLSLRANPNDNIWFVLALESVPAQ